MLESLPNVEILRSRKNYGFYDSLSEADKEELTKVHNSILDSLLEKAKSGACCMVLMDELTYPVKWGLLDRNKLGALLEMGKEGGAGNVEIVITGRDAKDFLKNAADYITQMECVRHPYEKGVAAREGIEFAREMLPLMRREAFWEVCTPWIWDCGEKTDAVYEGVVMTLGTGLDCLQESYHKKGMLTESYMLEALASELLLHGYKAYNRHVREAGGWHVARYHFPGSEKSLPLEMLSDMLSRFSVQVSCNEAFCIMPKKSVVFLAELTQDETVRCEGICVGCENAGCSNRMEEDATAKFSPTY